MLVRSPHQLHGKSVSLLVQPVCLPSALSRRIFKSPKLLKGLEVRDILNHTPPFPVGRQPPGAKCRPRQKGDEGRPPHYFHHMTCIYVHDCFTRLHLFDGNTPNKTAILVEDLNVFPVFNLQTSPTRQDPITLMSYNWHYPRDVNA